MLRFFLTAVAYAVALVLVGFVTYSVAPPGANAMTALVMSSLIAGLMIVCAIFALAIKKNRTLGMIGIHVGLVVPLLAIGGTGARLGGSLANANAANESIERIMLLMELDQPATLVDRGQDAEDSRYAVRVSEADSAAADALFNPIGYQTVGIGSTAILSAFAFVALLSHRPRVPEAEPDADQ